MKIMVFDKYGWPVETFKRRPPTNVIRYLLHGRRIGFYSPHTALTKWACPSCGSYWAAEQESPVDTGRAQADSV